MNNRTARLLWRASTAARMPKREYYAMWKRMPRKKRPELRAQLKAIVEAYETGHSRGAFRMRPNRKGVWTMLTGSAR